MKKLSLIKNKVKKGIQTLKTKIEETKTNVQVKFILVTTTVLYVTSNTASLVYAAGSNTQSIDGFITFVCDWLFKIGGVVAMVGAVMFALGWQREDSEGKTRGLLTLMAGFMLVAISQSRGLFGL